jgi:hypothetical protein
MNKKLAIVVSGLVVVVFMALSYVSEKQQTAKVESVATKDSNKDVTKNTENLDLGKQLAKNMATGEVILMASCLGKQGAIPRNKMGDYIGAAVEKQGISRAELFNNWDKYWSYAKEAEKRNRTSCLD